MDLLVCPVCGQELRRLSEGVAFDCVNGCRVSDPDAWVQARWHQIDDEWTHKEPDDGSSKN